MSERAVAIGVTKWCDRMADTIRDAPFFHGKDDHVVISSVSSIDIVDLRRPQSALELAPWNEMLDEEVGRGKEMKPSGLSFERNADV